jgi:hypothetical protein
MRGVKLAGVLLLAMLVWRAARRAPPAAVSAPAVRELEEILASHNDNDPRLDADFNALTDAEKALFRAKYREIAAERRNERGTIVHLLGKNVRGPEDWAFLREVAGEAPCLSLADCSKPAAAGEPGDDVTLAYPSLVALKRAQQALAERTDVEEARKVVAIGRKSKMPAVVRLSEKLDRNFPVR